MIAMKRDETPENLRPYIFHGVDLQWRGNDSNAIAECPFCGKEEKFNVTTNEGVYRCWSCHSTGNIYPFMAKLLELSERETTTQDYIAFANQRSLDVDTPIHWQLAKSYMTGHWLIPGYNIKGTVTQLYRYSKTEDGMQLLPTPTKRLSGKISKEDKGHGLHHCGTFVKKKPQIFLCEGPWDAMALWEVLGRTELLEGGELVECANPDRSILNEVNVLGAPGCSVFAKHWLKLFEKKDVAILFDNDHPKENPKTKKMIEPAGWQGVRRIGSMLQRKANSVTYLSWKDVTNDKA